MGGREASAAEKRRRLDELRSVLQRGDRPALVGVSKTAERLDSAELRLEREEAERRRARRRAEVGRRGAARWLARHVFGDCETCPEMVVLPGSIVAPGRYEVTLGE